jgi:hypothetical protein
MSMVSAKLAQFLEIAREAPYTMGALASLPLGAVMMLLWIYYELVAIAWFFLFMAFGGAWVFDKTPLRKMICTALFLGTFVPFSIWYWVIVNPNR